MENDQAFEAEARIDDHSKSARNRNTGHDGHDSTKDALGGFEFPEEHDEDTPLLRQEAAYGSTTQGVSEEDGDTPGPSGGSWAGEENFKDRPWYRRPSVYWLLPPFALYAAAWGGMIVPRINMILNLLCDEYFSDRSMQDPTFSFMPVIMGDDNPQCRIPEVQALVSKFQLYGMVIGGILSAISSPKLGALSDRYGRTKLMALTSSGMILNELMFIYVASNPDVMSVYWLLIGYAFDGLCGSFTAGMAITHAYATDCTRPARRNIVFAYFHGCLFSGLAFGPIAAGYIVKATGQILTIFYVALGAHVLWVLTVLLIVPESLTKERQILAREKASLIGKAESLARERRISTSSGFMATHIDSDWHYKMWWIARGGGLFTPLKVLWPSGPGTAAVRRNLVVLAAVDATMFAVAMGSMGIIVIYSEYMFGWTTFEASRFLSIVNVARVLCLIGLLPLLTRIIRGKASKAPQGHTGCDTADLVLIRIALVFDLSGYIGYSLARSGDMLTLSAVIASLGGMGSPTLQSSLTKHVPADRTGQLLGAIGLLHALVRVVSPALFNSIYAATVADFPQTVFVCLSAGFGLAFLLSWFIRPHVYYNEIIPIPPELSSNNEESDQVR
ncbi:hypothetical protein MMC25_001626 [Agyrium rufum]|nr:hypothetical protein [Agyrium rufum]